MSANAVKLDQLRVRAHTGNTLGQLALLLRREQDVGAYTNDEGSLELQSLETTFERTAIAPNLT